MNSSKKFIITAAFLCSTALNVSAQNSNVNQNNSGYAGQPGNVKNPNPTYNNDVKNPDYNGGNIQQPDYNNQTDQSGNNLPQNNSGNQQYPNGNGNNPNPNYNNGTIQTPENSTGNQQNPNGNNNWKNENSTTNPTFNNNPNAPAGSNGNPENTQRTQTTIQTRVTQPATSDTVKVKHNKTTHKHKTASSTDGGYSPKTGTSTNTKKNVQHSKTEIKNTDGNGTNKEIRQEQHKTVIKKDSLR